MKLQEIGRDWRPPAELGYPNPRPVRLRAGGWVLAALAVLFGIAAPALGAVLWNQSKREEGNRLRLEREGVAVDAKIERLWRSGGKSDAHHVRYRFRSEGGEQTGSATVPAGIWKALRVGDTLAIRYVPGASQVSHPIAWNYNVTPVWVVWLVSVIFLGDAGLLWWIIQRQMRLLSEGRTAPALVTKRIGANRRCVVRYEFRTPDGVVRRGRSKARSRSAPVEGSVVTVLYDPDSPRLNAAYPLELVRLDNADE